VPLRRKYGANTRLRGQHAKVRPALIAHRTALAVLGVLLGALLPALVASVTKFVQADDLTLLWRPFWFFGFWRGLITLVLLIGCAAIARFKFLAVTGCAAFWFAISLWLEAALSV
jgi:hypothetical protein